MSAPLPRLMTEETARAYLDGTSPRSVMPPLKIGNRCLWDRKALEKRIDEMSGLASDDSKEPKSALEAWEAEHGDDAA